MDATDKDKDKDKDKAILLRNRARNIAVLSFGLVLYSLIGFNATLTLIFIVIPLAIAALASALLSWNGYTRDSIRPRLLLVLSGIVLLIVMPVSFAIHNRILENRLQPVIVALETYNNIDGEYPGVLDALVPEYSESIPDCPKHPLVYSRSENGDLKRFTLVCVTFGFNKHQYNSDTETWIDWD